MNDFDFDGGIVSDEYITQKCSVIGGNIRKERLKRSYSIEEIAFFVGLSPSYMGLLERGLRCPSLRCIFKICDLFNIPPDKLLLEPKQGKTISEKSPARATRAEAVELVKSFSKEDIPFISSILRSLLAKFYGKK